MPEAHEIPVEVMSPTVVQANLSEGGFGVSEIYESVPNEVEDIGKNEALGCGSEDRR